MGLPAFWKHWDGAWGGVFLVIVFICMDVFLVGSDTPRLSSPHNNKMCFFWAAVSTWQWFSSLPSSALKKALLLHSFNLTSASRLSLLRFSHVAPCLPFGFQHSTYTHLCTAGAIHLPLHYKRFGRHRKSVLQKCCYVGFYGKRLPLGRELSSLFFPPHVVVFHVGLYTREHAGLSGYH